MIASVSCIEAFIYLLDEITLYGSSILLTLPDLAFISYMWSIRVLDETEG